MKDIRYYGLLKTIGTTGRQVRQILKRQALRLCLMGIPAGLILGFLIGRWIVPMVLDLTLYGGGRSAVSIYFYPKACEDRRRGVSRGSGALYGWEHGEEEAEEVHRRREAWKDGSVQHRQEQEADCGRHCVAVSGSRIAKLYIHADALF